MKISLYSITEVDSSTAAVWQQQWRRWN